MALIASLMRVMPSDTWRPSTKAKPRPASVASASVVTMMATEFLFAGLSGGQT